ncbi:hypothetical protein MIZ01_0435 [Sideroxyarcus emersonii]|uniref:Uncharacterized protein n=1 Tax=Sideroxyarcus emersonii TaxID=2764705 RepID=A0AAN1X8Q3_9PROT|nr:hypothetical protein MIZ01_0435 [Sideroxyarcus emersonii]
MVDKDSRFAQDIRSGTEETAKSADEAGKAGYPRTKYAARQLRIRRREALSPSSEGDIYV